jgi:hypothetical protein
VINREILRSVVPNQVWSRYSELIAMEFGMDKSYCRSTANYMPSLSWVPSLKCENLETASETNKFWLKFRHCAAFRTILLIDMLLSLNISG